MPAAVPYQRIATEEAWATRELIDLYLKMVETASNDPGFVSLWGHYGGGRSERVTQVLERLLDVVARGGHGNSGCRIEQLHTRRRQQQQLLVDAGSVHVAQPPLADGGMAWEPAVMFTRSVAGPDRVLYAMDYPYQYVPEEVDAMDRLPLDDREKKAFFQTNAEALFHL